MVKSCLYTVLFEDSYIHSHTRVCTPSLKTSEKIYKSLKKYGKLFEKERRKKKNKLTHTATTKMN